MFAIELIMNCGRDGETAGELKNRLVVSAWEGHSGTLGTAAVRVDAQHWPSQSVAC